MKHDDLLLRTGAEIMYDGLPRPSKAVDRRPWKAVVRLVSGRRQISGRPFRLLVALAILCTTCSLSGCGNSAVARNEPTVVYVCGKTHDVFVGPSQPTPARHPVTGEPSLMTGFYCPQCKTWYPGPPRDQLQRMRSGFLCPKHKKPMQLDGPIPEDAQRLPDPAGEMP